MIPGFGALRPLPDTHPFARRHPAIDPQLTAEILATIDEAVGVYDSQDRLIAFNAKYAEVREAIGGAISQGVPWVELVRASVLAGRIPEAIGREEAWLEYRTRMRGSYSIIRQIPDGRWFQVNERRMPGGGVAVVWTDISRMHNEMERHRQTADELRNLKASLEQRVEERTAELQDALTQRDLLLREVYHRVKNNLQVVDALIATERRGLTDQCAREALSGLRGRIRTLGLVHTQLMASDNLRTFDIAPFLRQLIDDLSRSAFRTGCGVTLESVSAHVTMDFAIPLGLIVNELVTNAVKHACPASGETQVVVTFSDVPDGGFRLTVGDNGSDPLAPDRIRDGSGNGGQILLGLLGQMDATIVVGFAGGTQVDIHLPAEET